MTNPGRGCLAMTVRCMVLVSMVIGLLVSLLLVVAIAGYQNVVPSWRNNWPMSTSALAVPRTVPVTFERPARSR